MTPARWKAELERDGVVHLPAALDSSDVEKLAALSLQSIDDYSASEDMYRTSKGVPIKLAYPLDKYQDFVFVLGNKRVIEIVDSLFSKEDSVLAWEDVLIKMPDRGAAVFPHQDISMKATGESAYALGISLHADNTNPVFFLPGSHRLGPLTATAVRIIGKECMHKFAPVVTQPGDIVIHDVHTLHYSEPNFAKQPRCTWYVEFRSMQSLLESGPWSPDWVYRRRAIWLYARASTGENVGEDEPDAVKDYLARLPSERDCFRVPHISETVRYDESSPYNHFAPSTDDWKTSVPAPEGTHHLKSVHGDALYQTRYDEVMPFHAPGLAPTRLGDQAFHILPNGKPAYMERFDRTFGFYENLAAVNNERGWFHIHPDGVSAYAERHSWCGNFQGGRCVVCENGRYYHISADGRLPYSQTYAYAGDFREGCAVVTSADGLCGHILADGTPAHPHRYRNLDVYHKGYARAQDENGWMHIDRRGVPAYENRYSSVEPFYNGRSLVQTFDDKTLVINDLGDAVVVIKDPALSATENNTRERYRQFHELSSDMVGYWKTFAIAAAVKLNVPEKLPLADTAMTDCFGESAANMKLLLAALAQMNITANTDGVWDLTSKGSLLLANGDFSLADAAVSWGTFATSGADAWTNALAGKTNADFFAEISRDISKVERSQKTLAAYAKNDYEFLADMLPLDNVRHLLDAGGGCGTVARMIARKWQNLNITILDRADVLSLFDDRDNPGGRITKLGGDIFLDWQTRADAVLLARVLHDWNDQKAALILAKANLALPLGGKLFVVEADGEATGAMVSLHLLTVGGGRQRTRQEYQVLMTENGFSFVEYRYMNRSASLLIGEKIK